MIMKKHNFLLLTFFSIVICSCNGMYDNINIYYDEGETNYIAKPDLRKSAHVPMHSDSATERIMMKYICVKF